MQGRQREHYTPFYLNFHATTSLAKSLVAALGSYQLLLLCGCVHNEEQDPWACRLLKTVGVRERQVPREPLHILCYLPERNLSH